MASNLAAQDLIGEIDFLPEHFRRQHAERHFQPWRILAVCMAAGLVIAAAAGQSRQRAELDAELAGLQTGYQQALKQQDQLVRLQGQMQHARTAAELFTYLEFPWPRSQLLAALAGMLPEQITFDEIHIHTRTEQGAAPLQRRSRAEAAQSAEQTAKLHPAAQDLAQLRAQWDQARLAVVVAGTTTDSMALHRYLAALAEYPLIEDAELDSMETLTGGQQSRVQFQATLMVRPGYGQPNGPAGPLEASTMAQRTSDSKADTPADNPGFPPRADAGPEAAASPAGEAQAAARRPSATAGSFERGRP